MRPVLLLLAVLSAGCLRSDATAPTRPAERAPSPAPAATRPAPVTPPKPEPVVRLAHLRDKTPWEEYRANPAAADLKFKGKLVEFVMSAEVEALPGGGYALTNWMRHNLRAAGDRPMHVVRLKPDQVEKAAKVKKDQVVTVRARLVECRDTPDGAMGKCVVFDDGEVLALMRWDAAARAYVPE